jgi:hypothetical protein
MLFYVVLLHFQINAIFLVHVYVFSLCRVDTDLYSALNCTLDRLTGSDLKVHQLEAHGNVDQKIGARNQAERESSKRTESSITLLLGQMFSSVDRLRYLSPGSRYVKCVQKLVLGLT